MITLNTNFSEILGAEISKLSSFDAKRICMMQAAYVAGEWRKRIHQDGIAADGSQIGTYSPGYMKVRTGLFSNADLYKRGKKKGEAKNSGLYSRGDNKGKSRPKYNRTNDTKVIASLTRQMENSMAAIPTDTGAAVAYHDDLSMKKSKWVEATYGKKIFALTKEEKDSVIEIAKNEAKNMLL
jgi:hypothetical protein